MKLFSRLAQRAPLDKDSDLSHSRRDIKPVKMLFAFLELMQRLSIEHAAPGTSAA
jgi:hypothetical protein